MVDEEFEVDEEFDFRPDEPVPGFVVTPMADLPKRLLPKRFDPNPERVSSGYDELRWG